MDPRKKNQAAQQKQQVRVQKKAQQKDVQQKIAQASTDQLQAKLSKRNEDYLFRLRKALIAQGKTAAQAQTLIDNLLVEIIQAQMQGTEERQLYGTVDQKVNVLLNKKPENTSRMPEFWKASVDNSLLFGALFTVMYGIVGFTTKHPDRSNQSGIVTIILLSILWGILITWFTQQMQQARSKRQPIWRISLILVFGLLVMYAIMFITTILPPVINPILNPWLYIILAACAYGARWLFRHYYHIQYNSFTGR